jgi:T-complex protein 1 subunit beta
LSIQLIKFSGVAAGEACTVVLRGATSQMIEEADRSLHDALSVLSQTVKETRIVMGGGCAEMAMANAVDEEAKRTEGKKALAVESFAKALRQVRPFSHLSLTHTHAVHRSLPSLPTTQDTTRQTWSPSCEQRTTRDDPSRDWVSLTPPATPSYTDEASADMELGVIGSMRELGITESYKLKRQVVLSASEAAEMILRVDDSAYLPSSLANDS